MTLLEKLETINNPNIPVLKNGFAKTISDYWDTFIEPHLPCNINSVIEWHKLLKEYVIIPDTVLGFRTGNTAGNLRRGWKTVTNDNYSFFYTDNYFSHYFYKMSFDGFVPSLDEFYSLMKSGIFPVRFTSPMGTKDEPWEKEFAAFNVDGKNPGLGIAGYKLAHVLDAGNNYIFNGINLGITEICKKFFNLGDVSDWKKNEKTNKYCRNNFIIPNDYKKTARKLAEACFLRMVHPMNYFISPKSKNQGKIYNIYNKGNNIAEDPNVLSYIRTKFHERYTKNGIDYFQDFLDLVFPFEDLIRESGNTILNVTYSKDDLTIGIKTINTKKDELTDNNNKTILKISNNLELNLAKEFLFNPNTSFRKLEREIMNIDSPARGGGFKSKSILNSLGITADKKGILYFNDIDNELQNASGPYKRILEKIKLSLVI